MMNVISKLFVLSLVCLTGLLISCATNKHGVHDIDGHKNITDASYDYPVDVCITPLQVRP